VRSIAVNQPQVVIDCTILLETKKVKPLMREVLPFVYSGSPVTSQMGNGWKG